MIVDQLVSEVQPLANGRVAIDVRVGLRYTVVLLDDGSSGLAATMSSGFACSSEYLGSFKNRDAAELIDFARSASSLSSTVGMATINALFKPEDGEITYGDVTKYLGVSKEDTLGMVGAFPPLIRWARGKAGRLFVFERYPLQGVEEYRPDWTEPLLLPQCSVVIVSATTIANKTLDGLLDCSRGARTVALVGPTTPLSSKVFANSKVSILSGVKIIDAHGLLEIVSQGGGARDFAGSAEKINMVLR